MGNDIVEQYRARSFAEIVRQRWDIRDQLLAQNHPVEFRQLCVALLRNGQLDEAIEQYARLIDRSTWSVADDYLELGAAHWLQGDTALATDWWQAAFNCKYGDGAKNMTSPLILYYAGVRLNDAALTKKASVAIERKLNTGWSKNWPAPLGRLISGQWERAQVEVAILKEHELRRPEATARLEFYCGVKLLEGGDEPAAKSAFTSSIEIQEQMTWHTEFVLAAFEVHQLDA